MARVGRSCGRGWFARVALLVALVAMGKSAVAGESAVKAYSFASPPLEIYDRLPELEMGSVPPLVEGERKLLEKLWRLQAKKDASYSAVKVDQADLLEAMLVASDVESPAARMKCREQFEKVVGGARGAVKEGKTDFERGELLLKFLHEGVLSKGYEGEQSSLAAIFESHQYNCVSSSAMYYLVGQRLGLQLRPIAIPGGFFMSGHAALNLLVGEKRIQIEPTNPDGFDWEAKMSRPGVFTIGPQPNRKDGYDIDPLGLAAMIYSNRGVTLGKAEPPRKLEAARCYLAALALDPLHASATQNLKALFTNWGPELVGEKKFEEATRVVAFGASIAPDVRDLRENKTYIWSKYIHWLLAAGRDDEAVGVMRRAASTIPDNKEFQAASYWFCQFGDNIIEETGWEEALPIAERAFRVLPAGEAKEVAKWRGNVYRRWSRSLLSKQDLDGSLQVIARGYAADPRSDEIKEGLAYHANEALFHLEQKEGLAVAVKCYQSLRKQFPQVDRLGEIGHYRASRSFDKLLDEKKYEEAVSAIGLYSELLTTPEQKAELGSYGYDRWARDLAEQKKWQECLDKYAEGLKAFPGQHRLTNNFIVAIDRWAGTAIDAKEWNEAIRIYDVGLAYFPKDSHLAHNKTYCQAMLRQENVP